jgi:hypothetical protein
MAFLKFRERLVFREPVRGLQNGGRVVCDGHTFSVFADWVALRVIFAIEGHDPEAGAVFTGFGQDVLRGGPDLRLGEAV